MLKRAESIRELHKHLDKVVTTGSFGENSRFAERALMMVVEQLNRIEMHLAHLDKRGKRRTPSKWNRFFAAGMKAGKSPAQISEEWKAKVGSE